MSAPTRRPLLAGTAVAALALVVACGGPGEPAPTATPDARPSASATPGPAVEPAPTPTATPLPDAGADATTPEFGATADAEPSADARLTVTGLRTGSHEGYDRVVVDLGGAGTPGWHVERQPAAVEDPTGETLDLGGEGVLAVYVTGLGYPFETGVEELPAGTRTPGGTVVTAAEFTGTFEGQTRVFLGLTDPEAPYRVLLLTDPLRLVVDVQRSMG